MNVDQQSAGDAFRRRMGELMSGLGCENQSEFAATLGFSVSSVNSWMRYAEPRLDALTRIARAGGVSLDWLLGLSDEGGPSAAGDHERLVDGAAEAARQAGEALDAARTSSTTRRKRAAGQ